MPSTEVDSRKSAGSLTGPQQGLILVGATLATVALLLGTRVLAPAGAVLNFVVPLPAVYAFLRAGHWIGGGVVLFTAAVLAGQQDYGTVLAYLLQFGIGSFLLPWLLSRGLAWDRAVALTLLAIVVLGAGVLASYSLGGEGSAVAGIESYLQDEIERARAIQIDNLPAEQLDEIERFTAAMADFLLRAWPGLAVMATGVFLLIMAWFAARIAPTGLPGAPFPQWRAPEHLIWILIAAGAGFAFGGAGVKTLAINVLVVLLPIYFLQGLAVVNFFFLKKRVAAGLRMVGYVMLFLLNPLPLLVTVVGVFDLWADFRKPRTRDQDSLTGGDR